MSNNYFTYSGKLNNESKIYYKDLPKEILSKLDTTILVRSVHLDSVFGMASLKGGYDPEKVSFNTLVKDGLLTDKMKNNGTN